MNGHDDEDNSELIDEMVLKTVEQEMNKTGSKIMDQLNDYQLK